MTGGFRVRLQLVMISYGEGAESSMMRGTSVRREQMIYIPPRSAADMRHAPCTRRELVVDR